MSELKACCGELPIIIPHPIKGIANKTHYFVRCGKCQRRTNDRKNAEGAIEEWNTRFYQPDPRLKEVVEEISDSWTDIDDCRVVTLDTLNSIFAKHFPELKERSE